jgi:hypothetical protein
MLVSEFSRKFILYYDVTSGNYVMNDPSRGTLFKRREIAESVKAHLGRGVALVKFTVRASCSNGFLLNQHNFRAVNALMAGGCGERGEQETAFGVRGHRLGGAVHGRCSLRRGGGAHPRRFHVTESWISS